MAPTIIKRYLIALNQHKLIGIATFALVTGISGVIAIGQEPPPPPTPQYKAQGVLSISTAPSILSETGVQINQQGTQIKPENLLTEEVVQPALAVAEAKPQEFKDKLKLEAGETDIKLEYEDQDPIKAKKTLEVLMQKMVVHSRSVNTARLRAIQDSIQERLPKAKEELTSAEQKLERYVRVEGAELLASQDGSLVASITGSQQQQRDIQIQTEAIETQINSLVRRLGLTPDQAYTSSALSADPIIADLRAKILDAETQLTILGRDLRPAHPTMVELREDLDAYEQLLSQRANEVIGGNGIGEPLTPTKIRQDSNLDPVRQQLANQLVALRTQQETLRSQLATLKRTEGELRQKYQNFPNKQLEQRRLEQELQRKQEFYNKLQAALADAEAAEAETVSNLSIALAAQVSDITPPTQAPASRGVILGGGVFFGLIAAGGLIFLLATLDNTFYTPGEVRELLAEYDVSLLGELPRVGSGSRQKGGTGIINKPDSPYLEFYELFRSNLRRFGKQPLKVVLITSTVEAEGKTVSAYNLAIASAQAGKRTLLVEADFRSNSYAHLLQVTPDSDARVQPIRYYSPVSGCVRLVPDIENLYIVPSPGAQKQAVAILESSELRQFLQDARTRFDFVVIDTPSLSRCNDARLLEPLADGMILVTRPGYTEENILSTALEELTEAEPSSLLGAVINCVDKPISVTGMGEVGSYYEEEIEYEETEEDDGSTTTTVTTDVTRS